MTLSISTKDTYYDHQILNIIRIIIMRAQNFTHVDIARTTEKCELLTLDTCMRVTVVGLSICLLPR